MSTLLELPERTYLSRPRASDRPEPVCYRCGQPFIIGERVDATASPSWVHPPDHGMVPPLYRVWHAPCRALHLYALCRQPVVHFGIPAAS